MKLYFPFIAIAVLISFNARAQNNPDDSVASRLMGGVAYDFNGKHKMLKDSTAYTYVGSNGGDLTHKLKYSCKTVYLADKKGKFSPNIAYMYSFNKAETDSNHQSVWADTGKYLSILNFICYPNDDGDDTVEIAERFGFNYNEGKYEWTTLFKGIYTYNAHHDITQEIGYAWETTLSKWKLQSKKILVYDSHNNLTSWYTSVWTGNDWVKEGEGARQIYKYDAAGNDTSLIKLVCNSKTLAYDTTERTLKTYYARTANDSLEIFEEWDDSTHKWGNSQTWVRTYDANNNMATEAGYDWDYGLSKKGDLPKWVLSYNETYTYNSFNQIIQTKHVITGKPNKWEFGSESDIIRYYQTYITKKKKKG